MAPQDRQGRGTPDADKDAPMRNLLSSVAETIWPALPDDAARARAAGRDAEARFLETSGGAYGGEVLTLIRAQLAPEARDQLMLLLKLLRRRSASPFLLGPRLCLPRRGASRSWRLRRFEELSVAERERVLLSWQRSPVPDLRLAFKALKSLVAGTVLTSVTGGKGAPGAAADDAAKTTDKADNPFWAGMGYSPESFVGSVAPADAEAAAAADEVAGAPAQKGKRWGGKGSGSSSNKKTATPPSSTAASAARPQPAVYAATLAAEEVLASAVLDAPSAAREARQQQQGASGSSASARLAERLSRARFCVVDPQAGQAAESAKQPPCATIEADAVVVGSGAGGAVAACLLARAGLRVVVVEKGPWRRARESSPYEGEAMRSLYESAGFVSTRDGGVGVLAGSALGGGTKINWCASLRTPRHVREEWAAAPHNLGEAVSGARFDAALDAVCERLLGAGWRLGGEVGEGGGNPVVVRPGASCWTSEVEEDKGGCCGGGAEVEGAAAKRGEGKAAASAVGIAATCAAAGPSNTPATRAPRPATVPLDGGQSGLPHQGHHSCTTERAGSNARLWDGLSRLQAAPRELPRNCASATCSAACVFGCASGNKASADVSWLADAARRGALVLARCHARRVLVESGDRRYSEEQEQPEQQQQQQQRLRAARPRRVTGVELDVLGCEDAGDDGPWAPADAPQPLLARVIVRAPLVFAAAGSLHTPALLLRSGIKVGGAVGRHLRLHPASGVVARFPSLSSSSGGASADANNNDGPVPLTFSSSAASSSPPAVDMYRGAMMATYSTFAARWPKGGGGGAAATAGKASDGPNDNNANANENVNDGYGSMVSVPVCHPGMLGATCQWESGRAFKRTLLPARDLALFLAFARDGGRGGRVRLGREGKPALDYWPRARDRRSMLDGLELAVRAAVAAGAVEVFLPHNTLGRLRLLSAAPDARRKEEASALERADAEALEAYVRRMRALGVPKYDLAVLSAHQMGSARMGSSSSKGGGTGSSVFDPRGECWDVAGLYVADASAFPTPSGVNPMVTVQALAHVVASGVVAEEAARRRRRAG